MAQDDLYKLWNPHEAAIDATLPQPIGTVRIEPKQHVPDEKMLRRGVTMDVLEPFVGPSFLAPTPPAERRRLLEAQGRAVPRDLVARTRHLSEFHDSASALETAPSAGPTSGGRAPEGSAGADRPAPVGGGSADAPPPAPVGGAFAGERPGPMHMGKGKGKR